VSSSCSTLLGMQVTLTIRSRTGYLGDVEVTAAEQTTAAELATPLRALTGSDDDAPIASAGRPLTDAAVLGGPGLRSGCTLTIGPTADRAVSVSSVLSLHVISGPDSGQVVPLSRGTHVIGRDAAADIVVDDPEVSRRHVQVDVGAHGVTIADLGSTNGTSVDGVAVGSDPRPLMPQSAVRVGNSALAIVGASEPPAALRPDPSGALFVNRPPHIDHVFNDAPIEFPATQLDNPRPKLQLLAALLPTLMGVALAVGMHNMQFLAFALLTPATMLASTASDRWGWRRSARRANADFARRLAAAESELDRRLADEIGHRRRRFPDAPTVLHAVTTPDCRLWERRPSDGAYLVVRLGMADQPATTHALRDGRPVADLTCDFVPATVCIADGALGIVGPGDLARGSARWAMAQVFALHSPRDVTVAALLGEASDHWRWLRWIPACTGPFATSAAEHNDLVADLLALMSERQQGHSGGLSKWAGPWLVLLVDPAQAAASIPGLRTLLDDGPAVGITAVLVDEDARLLPPYCRATARIAGDTGALLELAASGQPKLPQITAERVSVPWADAVARGLAPLRDADAQVCAGIPGSARLRDLIAFAELTPRSMLDGWSRPPSLVAPIGVGASGTIVLDLLRDGPHMLIAGSTGSGKSELLRSFVASLASRHAPHDVAFVLIDYKGGAAFAECAEFPHTLGVVTDLDGHLTARALTSLEAELRAREAAFADARVSDLADYRRHPRAAQRPLPRLLLVVDEFASLAEELPAFLSGLIGIAQRGRSLGVHLVLATQRPAGVVSGEIKANMALRLALRVTDPGESSDVIGTDDAARISKNTPGRAFARLADGLVEFQTAQVGVVFDDDVSELAITPLDAWNRSLDTLRRPVDGKSDLQLLRDAAREAARQLGRTLPCTPWLPPLPDVVTTSTLTTADRYRVPLGLADDPARQRQFTIRHDLAAGGSIGFVGGPRSGRSTALRTVIGQAARQLNADELHMYVVDCAGGSLRPIHELPHCGAVITRDDPACVGRVISRLADEVSARQRTLADLGLDNAAEAHASGAPMPALILAIGWESFHALSEQYDAGRSVDSVLQLLRDSAAAGLTIIIAGDRALLGIRTAAALSRKFLLDLIDRTDYGMVGISSNSLPAFFPPGRAIAAEDGCELQMAVLGLDPQTTTQWAAISEIAASQPATAGPAPFRICPLPSRVPPPKTIDLAPGQVLLGVGGDGAEPIVVDLTASDGRFLIAGPARSGRSTALIGMVEQLASNGMRPLIGAPARSRFAHWAHQHGYQTISPADQTLADDRDEADLLVVDDSEQFLDTPGGEQLAEWIANQPGEAIVLCVARSEDLIVSFRGLGVEVRRSRTGLLLQPSVADGELLGIRIAPQRQTPVPGRGLLVTDEHRAAAPNGLPIQIAAFAD
jgi:S-DNA-T family DNA segregation ATPase FtsK/SpoIIIE